MKPDQNESYWQNKSTEEIEGSVTPDEVLLSDSDKTDVPIGIREDGDEEVIHWTASEYIHVKKGPGWYVGFVFITLVLIAIDVLFLRTYTLSLLVVVMAIAVVIYSRRPPAELHYVLSGRQGLYIGEQLYTFSHFKAFGVIKDGDHHFIKFIPMKRLSPGLSIYFPEEVGEQIVDILGARLPMENLKLDTIDIVVRRIGL
jgi:hypothetical protein